MEPGGGRRVAGWATLAALALLASGGAAAQPGGMQLGLPALSAALLILAGLLLIARTDAARGAGLWLGLAPVPLLLLSGLSLPGVRALSGPPLFALALAGLAFVLATSPPRVPRAVFFPAVLALYVCVSARVQVQVGPEGDEPHYLMVADSLLRDQDLSLEADYAEGRYASFYGKKLEAHYRVRGRGGAIYSLHAVGLSILILPAYALGGYPGVSFFMALLGAVLAREIRELLRVFTGREGLAEGVGWLVALSPPLVHYAGLIFTEVPAALCVALVIRRARDLRDSRSAAMVGLALAFLPWLNVRYAPVAALLVLYVLAERPALRRTIVALLPSVASAIGVVVYYKVLYGFWDPRRVYGDHPEVSWRLLPEGLQGLLFDQEFGLLAYAPVFALVVPGLLAVARERRRDILLVVTMLAVVVLPAGAWPMWRGGWNPPARFLVPVVPVMAVALAGALARGLAAGPALLVGWGLWTGLTGACDPRLVHRDRDGTAPLFREASGAEEWTRLLPAYVLAGQEPARHRLALVWLSALGLACLGCRRPQPTAGHLAVALGGLLGAAGLASALSVARTEGRDAVRVIGRPALIVPGWAPVPRADARWSTAALIWGPTYEPHRHPGGAALGRRLALPSGRYRLLIEGEEPSATAAAGWIEARGEGPGPSRVTPLERTAKGLSADLEVPAGERGTTLLLRGGGPLIVKTVRLERSTFP